jgi:hypothetical protein
MVKRQDKSASGLLRLRRYSQFADPFGDSRPAVQTLRKPGPEELEEVAKSFLAGLTTKGTAVAAPFLLASCESDYAAI